MRKILIIAAFFATTIASVGQNSFSELVKNGNKEVSSNNYAKALEFFGKAIDMGNEDSTEIAWTASLAVVCAQRVQDNAKAINYSRIAINYKTTDLTIYEAQLDLAKKMKDVKTTEETLLAGRKNLAGQHEKYTSKLLYFYYNNKMFDKVILTAEEVLEYKPNNIKALYFKGVSYLVLNNEVDAVKTFKYVLSIDSLDVNTNKQLGLIYFNKASKIHDNSKAHYNSLKKPTRLDYSNYRKEIETAKIPYKQAMPYLEKSYNAKPNEQLKDALWLLYTRIEDKDMASKYKTDN